MRIFVLLLIIFMHFSSFARVKVIAVMDFKSSKIRYSTVKRLSKSIRNKLKNNKSLYVVDENLMNTVLKSQNVKNNCFDNPCYFGMGSLMGAQLMVTGEIYKDGNSFDIKLYLLDISNREILNEVSFSSTSKYKYVKQRILKNVSNLFKQKPKRIIVDSRKIKLREGEKYRFHYSLLPVASFDDVKLSITNTSILSRLENKTVIANKKGTSFVILSSESNPSIRVRVEVVVVRENRMNFSYEPAKKSKSTLELGINQVFIEPYLYGSGDYNGPTFGGGVKVALDKLSKKHMIFALYDYSLLPKGIWWYKENFLKGGGVGYQYRGFEHYSPGFVLGKWDHRVRTYYDKNYSDYIEDNNTYYLSLCFSYYKKNIDYSLKLYASDKPLISVLIGYKFYFTK